MKTDLIFILRETKKYSRVSRDFSTSYVLPNIIFFERIALMSSAENYEEKLVLRSFHRETQAK